MASIKIYEDQENQRPKLHAVSKAGGTQKRAVLGSISCNTNDENVQKPREKKPLMVPSKPSNSTNVQNKENPQQENKDLKIIIPVAQFEAFKVYEDEGVRIEEKLGAKSSIYNVYKGNEERFFSKQDVADVQKNLKIKKLLNLKIKNKVVKVNTLK